MAIKALIIQATRIVKSNIILIAILSFAGIWLLTDSKAMNVMSFINILLFAFLEPIVYGRCIESIRNLQHGTVTDLLSTHLLDFWIVSIILIIPGIITRTVLSEVTSSIDTRMIGLVIGAAVNIIAIYIFPVVFINNYSYRAVPMGIKYLFSNLKKSFLLILFILVEFAIKIAAHQTVHHLNAPQENILIVMSIVYICNILTLCIGLIVFCIASVNIIDQPA